MVSFHSIGLLHPYFRYFVWGRHGEKMSYLTRNEKMKRSGKGWWNWSIPAFQSESGFRTCPGAKDCIMGCYARPGQGWYGYPHVKKAQERRLALSKTDDFIEDWILIAKHFPKIQFYSYTKNIPLVQEFFWPENWVMIYSEGGKYDHMINRAWQRHSRVFKFEEDIEPAGYANASHNDAVALGENHRIGLAYHGRSKDRAFQTGELHAL